jgi:hypothetical protein
MGFKSRTTLANEAERIVDKMHFGGALWEGIDRDRKVEMVTDMLQASQRLDDERSLKQQAEAEAFYNSPEAMESEHGFIKHQSWLQIRANRISGRSGRLFDSDIDHQQFVRVTICHAERKRELRHDFIMERGAPLMEIDMSMAQWGAFVSSFGSSGVPATLGFWDGHQIPREPYDAERRLEASLREVRGAANEAAENLENRLSALSEAIATGKIGAIKAAWRDVEINLGNLPSNMAYVAKTFSGHVEETITKARFDIEAAVVGMAERLQIDPADLRGSMIELLPSTIEVDEHDQQIVHQD